MKDFKSIGTALKCAGVEAGKDVYPILAAILHLGNVQFRNYAKGTQGDGAYIVSTGLSGIAEEDKQQISSIHSSASSTKSANA